MGIYIALLVVVVLAYSFVAAAAGAAFTALCGPACLLGDSVALTAGAVAATALVLNRVVLLLPANRITHVAYHVVTVVFYIAVVAAINAIMPW